MIKILFKWLPPLLIILIAGGISSYWLKNKPRANRSTPKKVIPLVEFITPEFKDHTLSVHAMGNVLAAQSVNLTSRINGMIISTNPQFIEGGMLKKGEEIVRLDPTDYKLAIAGRQSEVEKARFNLKLEQGQQAVAQREYELLGVNLSPKEKELVLRKPHLNAAKASLNASEAALKQAQLNLNRTQVIAPFDAIIINRNANIGSWVSTFSTGTPLVQLVGINKFWIDVSLSVDKLRWISIPEINSKTGSKVKISYETGWGKGIYRYGVIKRLKAEIESEGRMAKLIVEVDDPLSQKSKNKNAPPLMLGTFVRLDIAGKTFEDVAEIPETLLHDGNKLWLMSAENTLKIHAITPVWREQGNVYLPKEQLSVDAQIISSDLSTPVQGMSLRSVKIATQGNN